MISYTSLVTYFHQLIGLCHIFILVVHGHLPETVQETVYAVDSLVIPLGIQLWRSHEQLVKTQGVTAVISYRSSGETTFPLGLTHLDTVLSGDHTLVEELLERLIEVDHSDII